MKHKDLPYIHHILDEISKIENSSYKLTKELFESNVDLIDAMIRRIEIIGEAVKNLSPHLKERYTNISWENIAGMRDKLIHKYFEVDLDVVWNVISTDIPKLKEKILEIKKYLEINEI